VASQDAQNRFLGSTTSNRVAIIGFIDQIALPESAYLRPAENEENGLECDGKEEGYSPNVEEIDRGGSLGAACHRMMMEGDDAMRAAHRPGHGSGELELNRLVSMAASCRRPTADADCCLTCGSV
jgi:hypothetical protein